jgi:hypothetical protein
VGLSAPLEDSHEHSGLPRKAGSQPLRRQPFQCIPDLFSQSHILGIGRIAVVLADRRAST